MIVDMLALMIVIPFFLVGISLIYVKDLKFTSRMMAAFAIYQLGAIAWLVWPLLTGNLKVIEITRDFACTRFDAAFILLTAGVATSALIHGVIYYDEMLSEAKPPSSFAVRLNYAFVLFFVLGMYIVYLCKN